MISSELRDFVRARVDEDVASATTPHETAEAEAKERILDIASGMELRFLAHGDEEAAGYGDVMVRHLAATYAQHPDYRVEWKPPPYGRRLQTGRRSLRLGRLVILWI